ncbi:membrane protein [Shewanella colwelliana]|uniref:Membrane protein n=2 Tax=Shewanella colwelliana TaxID=23 RepID=A0ABQ4P029_SHECO|nr:membrane protein [Shewanella colwelliana]
MWTIYGLAVEQDLLVTVMKNLCSFILLTVWALYSPVTLGWSDMDKDGVPDLKDACPNTVVGSVVDAVGCNKNPAVSVCLQTVDGSFYPEQCQKATRLAVYFAFSSSEVSFSQWQSLADIKRFLSENNGKICLEGHTDAIGEVGFNQQLSVDRALSVEKILVEDYGFSPTRFSIVGHGSEQPIADNQVEAGRALNRRVEFLLETN